MKTLSSRRRRILKIRELEHRVAHIRQANAEATVANLDRVRSRLTALRLSLAPNVELTRGYALNAMAEMASRLEDANADLTAPLNDAQSNRQRLHTERLFAKTRQDGAEKLHNRARAAETSDQARRADAHRIYRKRMITAGGAK